MSLQQYFQSILDRLHTSASVKTVYGDPIIAEGKTIIPVAKVAYGFGAGACPVRKSDGEDQTEGKEAGGGGGGICARPVGVVEITKEGTKFVPIDERKKLAGVLLVGLLLGLWLGSRRSRK
jgi:uncharacterized spore protein YtfJ